MFTSVQCYYTVSTASKLFQCGIQIFFPTWVGAKGAMRIFKNTSNQCTALIFKSMWRLWQCIIIKWSISAAFLADKWLCCNSSTDLLFNLSIGKQRACGCNGNDRDASIHSILYDKTGSHYRVSVQQSKKPVIICSGCCRKTLLDGVFLCIMNQYSILVIFKIKIY